MLSDSEFVTELDITVNELIDRYVSRKVDKDELRRIEGYFLKSLERREKLRFAEALKERQARPHKIERPPRSYTRYLALAACLLVVSGLSFWVWRSYFAQRNIDKGLSALQAAYREQRPVTARLSGFSYAPLANQRGGSTRVDSIQRDLAGTILLSEVARHPTAQAHHAAGQYYLAAGEFNSAIEQLNAAADLDPNNAKIQSDLGAVLLEQGKLERSRRGSGKELEIFARSLEHFNQAIHLNNSLLEAHFNRALVLQEMMPSVQAEDAWEEYLQKDSSSPWADEARKNLGLIRERSQTTFHINDELIDLKTATHEHDDDRAWNLVSTSYTSAGNDLTNRLLDEITGAERVTGVVDEKAAVNTLANVARLESSRSGDLYTTDLLQYYEKLTPIQKAILTTARLHMQQAYSLFTQSKFSEAIVEYSKAKSEYEKANNRIEETLVEYRLAHCYLFLPKLNTAESMFKKLTDVVEAKHYRWLYAQCLFGLAHARADRNAYSNAILHSRRALAEFERLGDVNGTLNALIQLADFHQAVNLLNDSLSYLSRGLALTHSERVKAPQKWGVLNQIGFSMTSLGLNAAALFYQKEALTVALEIGRPLITSRSHGYVGATYAALKMYKEAISEATFALQIGKSIEASPGGTEIVAKALLQLGDIHRAEGDCHDALDNYNQSIQLYTRLNFDYNNYLAHKGRLFCFLADSNDAAVAVELPRVFALAETSRSKITVDSQRNSYFDAEQNLYDAAITFEATRMHNTDAAFEYSESSRARSLLDAVENGIHADAEQGTHDFSELSITHPLSLSELRQRLPETAQVIQYAVVDDRLLIWVVTKAAAKYWDVPVTATSLFAEVKAYLESVSRRRLDHEFDWSAQAKKLYAILISPIESALDRTKTLCFVADKVLHYLPFAALMSPVSGRFLIEDYDILNAPSSTLLVNLSSAAERKVGNFPERLLVVGDPNFDREIFNSLPDIPSSATEARAISALYQNHHLLIGDNAKEEVIRKELEWCDVAHLAMHYVLNERSELLSGFPLASDRLHKDVASSDGFLQANEIYSMRLRRARLIVLSGCSTGIEREYKGEGAVGAARPFFVAGIPVVVASLWPVDSDASARLMESFHHYRNQKMPVRTALRNAQLYMALGSEAKYRHPYYWAAFVDIGAISTY